MGGGLGLFVAIKSLIFCCFNFCLLAGGGGDVTVSSPGSIFLFSLSNPPSSVSVSVSSSAPDTPVSHVVHIPVAVSSPVFLLLLGWFSVALGLLDLFLLFLMSRILSSSDSSFFFSSASSFSYLL